MPKKREHMNVFEWLLEMGPIKAVALIYAIAAIVLAISLWIIKWFTYNR